MEWGEMIFWLVLISQSFEWLLRLYIHWFGRKSVTFIELHSVLWHFFDELKQQVAELADPEEIKSIIFNSELRLRDKIENKHGKRR